jgi:hypothetical protein
VARREAVDSGRHAAPSYPKGDGTLPRTDPAHGAAPSWSSPALSGGPTSGGEPRRSCRPRPSRRVTRTWAPPRPTLDGEGRGSGGGAAATRHLPRRVRRRRWVPLHPTYYYRSFSFHGLHHGTKRTSARSPPWYGMRDQQLPPAHGRGHGQARLRPGESARAPGSRLACQPPSPARSVNQKPAPKGSLRGSNRPETALASPPSGGGRGPGWGCLPAPVPEDVRRGRIGSAARRRGGARAGSGRWAVTLPRARVSAPDLCHPTGRGALRAPARRGSRG